MADSETSHHLGKLFGTAEMRARRSAALERYAAWELEHPSQMSPSQAIAGIGFLFSLLPAAERERPVDTSGIQAMHASLSALGKRGS